MQKWDIASDSLIHTFPTSLAKGWVNGIVFLFNGKLFASPRKMIYALLDLEPEPGQGARWLGPSILTTAFLILVEL